MDQCRRTLLKRAGYAVLGAGCGLPLLHAAVGARQENYASAASTKHWGLAIDLERCRSEAVRRACIEACHRAHNVPHIPDPKEELKWIWSEDYQDVFSDQTHAHAAEPWKDQAVLVLCNHCERPPCTKVCPTGATWKRGQDGIVMMDMHRCIGCRYCMAACPYGARSFNWRDPRPYIDTIRPEYPTRTKGVVEKCDFCAERLRDNREPACVEAARAVPSGQGSLVFGDLADPESEISRLLRKRYAICRRPSLGTGPSVFYLV